MRNELDRIDDGQLSIDVEHEPIVRINIRSNGIGHRGLTQFRSLFGFDGLLSDCCSENIGENIGECPGRKSQAGC